MTSTETEAWGALDRARSAFDAARDAWHQSDRHIPSDLWDAYTDAAEQYSAQARHMHTIASEASHG